MKDHRHLAATHLAHCMLREGAEVLPVKINISAQGLYPIRKQAHECERRHGLPAAGLAKQGQGLSLPDAKGYAVHDTRTVSQAGHQPLDAQHMLTLHPRRKEGVGSTTGRLVSQYGHLCSIQARVERIAYGVSKKIGRQYQHQHESEGGSQGPPDHGLAPHLHACGIY